MGTNFNEKNDHRNNCDDHVQKAQEDSVGRCAAVHAHITFATSPGIVTNIRLIAQKGVANVQPHYERSR